jgi:hypothetical protein
VTPSIGRDNNDTLEVIMSEHAATPQFGAPAIRSLGDSAHRVTGYWWVLLVAGIAWVAVALVILQFDQASVTTVGVLVGLMFLLVQVVDHQLERPLDPLQLVQEPLYYHRAREARRRADPLDHVVAGGVGEGVDHVKPEPLRVTLAALDGDPRDSVVGCRGP